MNAQYFWLVAAFVLVGFEAFLPGISLWFGLGALCTFLSLYVFSFGFSVQIFLFIALSTLSLFFGRRFFKKKGDVEVEGHQTNERMQQYIGQVFLIQDEVRQGSGRIHVGDSSWLCYAGEDIDEGAEVRITGTRGIGFEVEKIN